MERERTSPATGVENDPIVKQWFMPLIDRADGMPLCGHPDPLLPTVAQHSSKDVSPRVIGLHDCCGGVILTEKDARTSELMLFDLEARLRKVDHLSLCVYRTSGPDSSPGRMLFDLAKQLDREWTCHQSPELFGGRESDLERLWDLLARSAAEQPVVLLITGLDQLAGTPLSEEWLWLPRILPRGVTLVGSSGFGARINRLFERPNFFKLRFKDFQQSESSDHVDTSSRADASPVSLPAELNPAAPSSGQKPKQATSTACAAESVPARVEEGRTGLDEAIAFWVGRLIIHQYKTRKTGLEEVLAQLRPGPRNDAWLSNVAQVAEALLRYPLLIRPEIELPLLERLMSLAEEADPTADAALGKSTLGALRHALGRAWIRQGRDDQAASVWVDLFESAQDETHRLFESSLSENRLGADLLGLDRLRSVFEDLADLCSRHLYRWKSQPNVTVPNHVDEEDQDVATLVARIELPVLQGRFDLPAQSWAGVITRLSAKLSQEATSDDQWVRLLKTLGSEPAMARGDDWAERILLPALEAAQSRAVGEYGGRLGEVVAAAWYELAELRFDHQRLSSAMHALDRCSEILHTLLPKHPWNGRLHQLAIHSLTLRSRLLMVEGRFKDAVAIAQNAVVLAEQRCADEPNEGIWRGLLSKARVMHGEILLRQGGVDAGLAEFRAALELHDQDSAMGRSAQDFEWAQALYKYGDALLTLGDAAAALASYRQALSPAQACQARKPLPARAGWIMAIIRAKIGDTLRLQGRQSGAEDEYRRALAALHDLCEQHPGRLSFRRDLAAVTERLAIMLTASDPEESLSLLNQVLEWMPPVDQGEETGDRRRDRMVTLRHIGRTYLTMNRPSEACRALTEATLHSGRLVAMDRGHLGWLEDHIRTLATLCEACRRSGRHQEGGAALEEAAGMLHPWLTFQPHAELPNRLSLDIHEAMAEFELNQGRVPQAVEHFQQAASSGLRLIKLDSSQHLIVHQYAGMVRREASLLAVLGQPDRALGVLAALLQTFENELQSVDPTVRHAEMAGTLAEAAGVLEQAGEAEQSEFYRLQSEEMFSQIDWKTLPGYRRPA